MNSPQALLQTLESALVNWQVFGKRAQLEAIMPILDTLANRKVGYAVMAKLLSDRDVMISADALRQALHRWRKRQECSPATNASTETFVEVRAGSQHLAEASAGAMKATSVPATALTPGNQSRPSRPAMTKAGLEDLRNETVDLEAIIRASRKMDSPG